ncbi:MAG: phenylalanine--tRNA ligase subunit beta [Cytophagales bacterium]|nr:phenylalanine--tRNA ligase subunit beta [Cytophagales bacterium]
MFISHHWLREYINIDLPTVEIGNLLTSIGLEVESIEVFESVKGGLKGLVAGEVITCSKHPNADKLKLTTVNIGANVPLNIVCGAANVAVGQKVVVATIGSTIYPKSKEPFTINKAEIRGHISEGMLCAEDEIGIGTSHDGIITLPSEVKPGTPFSAHYQVYTDYIYSIGLTPNRADAASHYGVARDLYAAICTQNPQTKYTLTKPTVNISNTNTITKYIDIQVLNHAACPRYAGVIMENVVVKPSPQWLQDKLRAININPINNIVDVTNYVLHECGQPLHAFDYDKIEGSVIMVKNATEGTTFTTLDGKTHKLDVSNLMIYDANKPMAIAGVFGGLHSAINTDTKNIFIESAYFDAAAVRKTSQRLGLKTDASYRFERGADPDMVIFALKRAAILIEDTSGGKPCSKWHDIYPNPIPYYKIDVKYKNIDRLCGEHIPQNVLFDILDNLEITIENETVDGFVALVPPYRVDVQREADIIEEIIRLKGFENFALSPTLGTEYLATQSNLSIGKIQEDISNMLSCNGFNEILTNSLTNPKYYQKAHYFESSENVQIINKLSPELSVMRQTLLYTSLEALAYNINRKQKNLKFYEFGKVYKKTSGDGYLATNYIEHNRLAIAGTGNELNESWQSHKQPFGYNTLKSYVSMVIQKLNINHHTFCKKEIHGFEYGTEIMIDKSCVGIMGKVKQEYAKSADVNVACFYAELFTDEIFALINNVKKYTPISKFPDVKRDLSLIIDKKISFADIEKVTYEADTRFIKNIHLTDIYEGDKIESNKKSYTIQYTLNVHTQTLTDELTDTIMQNLMTDYEKKIGAIIRK